MGQEENERNPNPNRFKQHDLWKEKKKGEEKKRERKGVEKRGIMMMIIFMEGFMERGEEGDLERKKKWPTGCEEHSSISFLKAKQCILRR